MSIIDVYDRGIVAYHNGFSCTAKDAVQALQQALLRRQQFSAEIKPVIRTDNGPQFVSHTFEEFCEKYQIEHERIPLRTPNMNAHIESFHRIFEDDCLSRWQFETYEKAYEAVTDFMVFYNERRMHSSILDLSPQEFYEQNKQNKLEIEEVRV